MADHWLSELVFGVLTDFTVVPALFVIALKRRHFELYVGVMQFICGLMYNLGHAIDDKNGWLIIKQANWHFMSDVFSLTYGCCLAIHLMGLKNENANIVLRYVSFTMAWISKYKDQWGADLWETVLILSMVMLAIVLFITQEHLWKAVDKLKFSTGLVFLGLAALLLFFEQDEDIDPYKLLLGAAHVFFGLGAFQLWRAVPIFEQRYKKDILPTTTAFT